MYECNYLWESLVVYTLLVVVAVQAYFLYVKKGDDFYLNSAHFARLADKHEVPHKLRLDFYHGCLKAQEYLSVAEESQDVETFLQVEGRAISDSLSLIGCPSSELAYKAGLSAYWNEYSKETLERIVKRKEPK